MRGLPTKSNRNLSKNVALKKESSRSFLSSPSQTNTRLNWHTPADPYEKRHITTHTLPKTSIKLTSPLEISKVSHTNIQKNTEEQINKKENLNTHSRRQNSPTYTYTKNVTNTHTHTQTLPLSTLSTHTCTQTLNIRRSNVDTPIQTDTETNREIQKEIEAKEEIQTNESKDTNEHIKKYIQPPFSTKHTNSKHANENNGANTHTNTQTNENTQRQAEIQTAIPTNQKTTGSTELLENIYNETVAYPEKNTDTKTHSKTKMYALTNTHTNAQTNAQFQEHEDSEMLVEKRKTSNFQPTFFNSSLDVMAKIDLERQRLELKKELTKFVMSRSHEQHYKPNWKQKLKERKRDFILIDLHKKITMIADKHTNTRTKNNTNMSRNRQEKTQTKKLPTTHINEDTFNYRDIYVEIPRNIHTRVNSYKVPQTDTHTGPIRTSHTNKHTNKRKDTNQRKHSERHRAVHSVLFPYVSSDEGLSSKVKKTASVTYNNDNGAYGQNVDADNAYSANSTNEDGDDGGLKYNYGGKRYNSLNIDDRNIDNRGGGWRGYFKNHHECHGKDYRRDTFKRKKVRKSLSSLSFLKSTESNMDLRLTSIDQLKDSEEVNAKKKFSGQLEMLEKNQKKMSAESLRMSSSYRKGIMKKNKNLYRTFQKKSPLFSLKASPPSTLKTNFSQTKRHFSSSPPFHSAHHNSFSSPFSSPSSFSSTTTTDQKDGNSQKIFCLKPGCRGHVSSQDDMNNNQEINLQDVLDYLESKSGEKKIHSNWGFKYSKNSLFDDDSIDSEKEKKFFVKTYGKQKPGITKTKSILKHDKTPSRNETFHMIKSKTKLSSSKSTIESSSSDSKTSSLKYNSSSYFLDTHKTSQNTSNQNSKLSFPKTKSYSQVSLYSPFLCFSTNNNSFASFLNLESRVRNLSLPHSFSSGAKQNDRFLSSKSELNLESAIKCNSCYRIGRNALKHISHVNRDINICKSAMESIRRKILNEVENHFKKKNNKKNNKVDKKNRTSKRNVIKSPINNENNNENNRTIYRNIENVNENHRTNNINNKNKKDNTNKMHSLDRSCGNSFKDYNSIKSKLNMNSNRANSFTHGCIEKKDEGSLKNCSIYRKDMVQADLKNGKKTIENIVDEYNLISGKMFASNMMKNAKVNDEKPLRKSWMKEKLFQKIKRKIDMSPKILSNITERLVKENENENVFNSLQSCFEKKTPSTITPPDKMIRNKTFHTQIAINNPIKIVDLLHNNNTKKQKSSYKTTENYNHTNNNRDNLNNNTDKYNKQANSFRGTYTYDSPRRLNFKQLLAPHTKERVIANCEINCKFTKNCANERCVHNLKPKKLRQLKTESDRLDVLKKRLDCTKYRQNYDKEKDKYKQFDKETIKNTYKNTEYHYQPAKREVYLNPHITQKPLNSPKNYKNSYKTNSRNAYKLYPAINNSRTIFSGDKTKKKSPSSAMNFSCKTATSRKKSNLFKGDTKMKKAGSYQAKEEKSFYRKKSKNFTDDAQTIKTQVAKMKINNNTPIKKTRTSKLNTKVKSPRETNQTFNTLDTNGWQDKIEYWKIPSDFNCNTHHVRPSPLRSNIFERIRRNDIAEDEDDDDDDDYSSNDSTTESSDETSDSSTRSSTKWWERAKQKTKKFPNRPKPYKKSSIKLNKKPEILKMQKASLNMRPTNTQKKPLKTSKGWLYSTPKYYKDFNDSCFRNNNLNNCPNDTLNKNLNTNPNNNPLKNSTLNRIFKSARTKPPWKPSGKYQDPISNFKKFKPYSPQKPICNFNKYNSCEKFPIANVCALDIEKYAIENYGLSNVGENLENQAQDDVLLQHQEQQIQQAITSRQPQLLLTPQLQLLTTPQPQPQVLTTPQPQLITTHSQTLPNLQAQRVEPINNCNYSAYPNQNYANNLQSTFQQQYNSNNYYNCCATHPVINNENKMEAQNNGKTHEDSAFMKKLQLNCCLDKFKGKFSEKNMKMSIEKNGKKLAELKEKIKKRALENEKKENSCCSEGDTENSCPGKDGNSKDLKSWWVDFKKKFEENASSCQICNFDKRSAEKKRKRTEKLKEKKMKKQCEVCYRNRLQSLHREKAQNSTQNLYKRRYNSINSDFVNFKKCSEIIKSRNCCENLADNIEKENISSENDCRPKNNVFDMIKKLKSNKSSFFLKKKSKAEKASNCEGVIQKICGNSDNEVSALRKNNEEPRKDSCTMKKIFVEQEVQMKLSTLDQKCQTENNAKKCKKDESSFENKVEETKICSELRNSCKNTVEENRKQSLFDQAKNCLKKFKSFKSKSSFTLGCSCCNNFEGNKIKFKNYACISGMDNSDTLANKTQDKKEKLNLEDELKKICCNKANELEVKESFNNQNNKGCLDFKAYVRKMKSKCEENDEKCDYNKVLSSKMQSLKKQTSVKFSDDSDVCGSIRKSSVKSRECSESNERSTRKTCKDQEKNSIPTKKRGRIKEICEELKSLIKHKKRSMTREKKRSFKQASVSRSPNKYKISLKDFGLTEAECICLKISQKAEQKKREMLKKKPDACSIKCPNKKAEGENNNYDLEYLGYDNSDCEVESSKKRSRRSKSRTLPLRLNKMKGDCLEEKKKDAVEKFELFRKLTKVDRTMKQFEKKMAKMKDLKALCEFDEKKVKNNKMAKDDSCMQLIEELEGCGKMRSDDECDMVISSLKSSSKVTEVCDKESTKDDCERICKSLYGGDDDDDDTCEKITKLIQKAKMDSWRRKAEKTEKDKTKFSNQKPAIFDKLDCLIQRRKSEKRRSWKKEDCADKKANLKNSKPDWLKKKLDEICGDLKSDKESKKKESSCEICKLLKENKKEPWHSSKHEQMEACDKDLCSFLNNKNLFDFLSDKNNDPCEFLNAKKRDSGKCSKNKTKNEDSFSDLCFPKKKASSLIFCLTKDERASDFCSSNFTFPNTLHHSKKSIKNPSYKVKKPRYSNLLKPSKNREELSQVEKYLTAYSSTSRESLTSCLRQMMMREKVEGAIKEFCEKKDRRC